MHRLTFVLLVATLASASGAGCPDFTFRCPTGESFTVNTCWKWSAFNCQTCRSVMSFLRDRCRKFSCGGSTSRWYGRDDGCSASIVSRPMTGIFRAACAIHDICYATPGRSQRSCDGDFKHNMLQTCRFPGLGSVGYPVCAAAAGAAYAAVKNHGNTFPSFAATCTEV